MEWHGAGDDGLSGLLASVARLPIGVLVVRPVLVDGLDGDVEVIGLNPALERLVGWSSEELAGQPLGGLDDALATALIEILLDEAGPARHIEHEGSSLRHLSVTCSRDEELIVASVVDITDEVEAANRSQRLVQLLDATSDLVIICDADLTEVRWCNDSAMYRLGIGDGRSLPDLLEPSTREVLLDQAVALVDRDGLWEGELVFEPAPGFEIPTIATVLRAVDPESGGLATAVVAKDTSPVKEIEAQLTWMAEHDPLTHLPNRRRIERILEERLADRRRAVAVLFIDLDNFKQVNDVLGHEAGDEVLLKVAQALSGIVRSEDVVGRLAGDEFVIILNTNDAEVATMVARRVTEVVAAPLQLHGGAEVHIGASVGIHLPDEGSGVAEALQHADAAMFEVKRGGKNAWAFR